MWGEMPILPGGPGSKRGRACARLSLSSGALLHLLLLRLLLLRLLPRLLSLLLPMRSIRTYNSEWSPAAAFIALRMDSSCARAAASPALLHAAGVTISAVYSQRDGSSTRDSDSAAPHLSDTCGGGAEGQRR